MKIDKVIFTCDDNPAYAGFWASISKHFKNKIGLNSHLFVICEDENRISAYSQDNGQVTFIKKLPKIPTIIQALWGKFYFTSTEPETTWMIGDLDLYPLQRNWFTTNIEKYSEESYLHLNGHAYGVDWHKNSSGLAGYYHVAKGKTFKEYLEMRSSFQDDCEYIFESRKYELQNSAAPHDWAKSASSYWKYFCCEEKYSAEILSKIKDKIITIPWPNNDMSKYRICRSNMNYDSNNISKEFYIDFHAPRPYEDYEKIINDIILKVPNYIMENVL